MRSYPSSILVPRVDHGFCSADPATEAKDASTRSLDVHVVGLLATTQADLDQQNALRDEKAICVYYLYR
ncbi:hypothetical protein Plhal304r1_c058g0145681 [Plasmopara halstedii]